MVFMASSIACRRVRTTMTTAAELPNMAAILQLIGRQRHTPLVCSGMMPSFLGGIFKEKKTHSYLIVMATNDSGG